MRKRETEKGTQKTVFYGSGKFKRTVIVNFAVYVRENYQDLFEFCAYRLS